MKKKVQRVAQKISGFWFVFFLLNFHGLSVAQVTDCSPFAIRKASDLYRYALELQPRNERKAKALLHEAVEACPDYVPAVFSLAKIYYFSALDVLDDVSQIEKFEEYYNLSQQYFGQVVEKAPSFENYMTYFFLGESHYDRREYNVADEYLAVFLKKNTTDCSELTKAQEMAKNIDTYFELKNNPVEDFNKIPVDGVCTERDEYFPLISPDSKYIFYTQSFKKQVPSSPLPVRVEVLMQARRISPLSADTDRYAPGEPLDFPFNQRGRDQGGLSITLDNKHLYITICEYVRSTYTSYKNCDIFASDFENGHWSPLRRLGSNINSRNTWEGQPSISADGKVLYFASTREGGLGGIDIYRSVLRPDGTWGDPVNLGPTINTQGDDKTPFIHSDSQTLYFASNGRFAMGGFDIYYAQYLGLGQWTAPKNIGYPINTYRDDVAFIVSTNGKKIYFASKETPESDYDIYSSVLHQEARPQKVLFVEGNLSDESNSDFDQTSIELQNVKTLKINTGLIDPATGKYAVAMAVGGSDEEFILTVKKPGYFFDSELIKPSQQDLTEPPKTVNFQMKPIKVGTKIKLKNIYFATNSARFDSVSLVSLNNFLEFLQINPTLKISLLGHTDSVGSRLHNKRLSWRRAKAVHDYLVAHGISAERVSYKGYGEDQPVASNATKQGRAKNRRTEFIVTVK